MGLSRDPVHPAQSLGLFKGRYRHPPASELPPRTGKLRSQPLIRSFRLRHHKVHAVHLGIKLLQKNVTSTWAATKDVGPSLQAGYPPMGRWRSSPQLSAAAQQQGIVHAGHGSPQKADVLNVRRRQSKSAPTGCAVAAREGRESLLFHTVGCNPQSDVHGTGAFGKRFGSDVVRSWGNHRGRLPCFTSPQPRQAVPVAHILDMAPQHQCLVDGDRPACILLFSPCREQAAGEPYCLSRRGSGAPSLPIVL